jgi:hypothetical protein
MMVGAKLWIFWNKMGTSYLVVQNLITYLKCHFFHFSPNKGHIRHGARKCCDILKHLGGNKSRTMLVFTLNNQKKSQLSRGHRQRFGKCSLGCDFRYICCTHSPMGGIAHFWQSWKGVITITHIIENIMIVWFFHVLKS